MNQEEAKKKNIEKAINALVAMYKTRAVVRPENFTAEQWADHKNITVGLRETLDLLYASL